MVMAFSASRSTEFAPQMSYVRPVSLCTDTPRRAHFTRHAAHIRAAHNRFHRAGQALRTAFSASFTVRLASLSGATEEVDDILRTSAASARAAFT